MEKARVHNVYVVELDKDVLKERKFLEANSGHDPEKACLYVGMTGLSPDERFKNHKEGRKANKYVKKYGLWLRRRIYTKYNPMTYEEAQRMEAWLARRLRAKGHAVWQN
ncbi:MAG: hypothetical protein JSW03_10110 [Candidatus Eiseniibacteriota bacterium]|nr:MAG: hypothetical protein JSW03_10110 [Candidatus Eisenbacteria bacterium]